MPSMAFPLPVRRRAAFEYKASKQHLVALPISHQTHIIAVGNMEHGALTGTGSARAGSLRRHQFRVPAPPSEPPPSGASGCCTLYATLVRHALQHLQGRADLLVPRARNDTNQVDVRPHQKAVPLRVRPKGYIKVKAAHRQQQDE